MPELSDLSSLWGAAPALGINPSVAPASIASQQANPQSAAQNPSADQTSPDNPYGNIIARLRASSNPSAQSGFANSPIASSMAALPNVTGKSKGSAFLTGLASGQAAQNQRAQAQAANQLAQMKLLWDHQNEQEKMRLEQQKAGVDAAYKKSLGAQADAAAKKTAQDAANPDKAKEFDPYRKMEALAGIAKQTGYDPNSNDPLVKDAWEKLTPAQQADKETQFRALFKWNFGTDYPVDPKTGKSVPPPPMPTMNPDGQGGFIAGVKKFFGGGATPPAAPGGPDPNTPPDVGATPGAPAQAPNGAAPTPGPVQFFKDADGNLFKKDATGSVAPASPADFAAQPPQPSGATPAPPGMVPATGSDGGQ